MATRNRKTPATKKIQTGTEKQGQNKIGKSDTPKGKEKKSTQFHFLRS